MICWKCKKEIALDKVFRSSECSFCHADLHCCKGCRFYMPGNHFDCKESVFEPIADKEKANFCDFFSSAGDELLSKKSEDKSKAARDAFNALFGGGLCL